MAKLKLAPVADEKSVRLTIDLPAPVYRDLLAYAEALGRETTSGSAIEPVKLVAPMLARFMTTDREFMRRRRASPRGQKAPPS